MNSPVHSPVDILDIRGHISPLGMQISGYKHILAKVCEIAPQSALWVSRHTGPDLSTCQIQEQFLSQGHENAHGPVKRNPKC